MADVQIFQRHWLIKCYLKAQTSYLKRAVGVAEVRAHLESHNIVATRHTVERDLLMLAVASKKVRQHPFNSTRWYYDQR